MTKNGETISYRVNVLEKCQEKTEMKLDSIMENHLPHLQQEIVELKTRISVLTVVNISAIILALIINKFL
jgi:hypothetical protein